MMKRREFVGACLSSTVAVSVLNKTVWANHPLRPESVNGCRVVQTGTEVELYASTFGFKLDVSAGLRARFWENKLSGRTIQFAGDSELDVDLDGAQERIWILGWKRTVSRASSTDFTQDPGYQEGYAHSEYDDSKWRDTINLTMGEESAASFTWARTHVTVP